MAAMNNRWFWEAAVGFDRRSSGNGSSVSGSSSSGIAGVGRTTLTQELDTAAPAHGTAGVGKSTLAQAIQRKSALSVGAAGGAHEAEADRVADQVGSALAGGPSPTAPVAVSPISESSAQGKGARAEGEVPDSVHAAVASSGAPLAPAVQRDMGRAFGGHDFSDVRVHTDATASRSAAELGAQAYTVGNNVVFGAGRYDPASAGGQSLLAHELTHTIQQRGSQLAQRRVIQRRPLTGDEPGATGEPKPAGNDKTDAEGNSYDEAAGKTYLTKPPVSPVPNHSGKFQALPANPHARYTALMGQVDAAAAQQLTYADGLKGGTLPPKNYRYWFAKVYHFVTKHEKIAITSGVYQYPLMKMQEVVWFQNAYKANCDAWDAGNKGKVEAHWQQAFAAAEAKASNDVNNTSTSLEHTAGAAGGAVAGATAGSFGGPLGMLIGAGIGAGIGYFGAKVVGDALTTGSRQVLAALLPSMQAHIRFDLPRAIAGCFTSYYAGVPTLSIGDFQADFEKMGPVFDAAQAELNPEIQEACGITDPGTWAIAQSQFPKFFDIVKERKTTWVKAEAIAAAKQKGLSSADTDKTVKTVTGVTHPMGGGEGDYQVDGHDINGFDWNNNPGVAPPQTSNP